MKEKFFIAPRNEDDLAKISQLVRSAIEEVTRGHDRMAGVLALLELMNPENAGAIRDAFDGSWADGFNYDWERQLFLARYGEVMGQEAAEEYRDDRFINRVIDGWASASPDEAVNWVNELEEGKFRDNAIVNVMYGAGIKDGEYAMRVFEVLNPQEQESRLEALMFVNRRRGGAEACADVANVLWEREDITGTMKTSALRQTDWIYRSSNDSDRQRWLETLSTEQLDSLDQTHLPEGFQKAAR